MIVYMLLSSLFTGKMLTLQELINERYLCSYDILIALFYLGTLFSSGANINEHFPIHRSLLLKNKNFF